MNTFTTTSTGTPVDASGSVPFIVDTPYANSLPIFWEGRNNAFAPSQIASDIAAQVQTVGPGQAYIVVGLTNDNQAPEWSGGYTYLRLVALNNQLASLYGSRFLDVRPLLVAQYDPSLITDVSDYQHDVVPTSLRAIDLTTSLASAIGPTDTTLTLASGGASLAIDDILTIDTGANAENASIVSISGNTVTVVRNYGGLNTSHAAGAQVVETDYIHLNASGYKIVADALAQLLSAYQN
jgi:hypothetical protein